MGEIRPAGAEFEGAVADLLAAEIPRFSNAEMARRRTALEAAMAASGVAHLMIYGAQRSGSAVQWLTGWPVTAEAAVIVSPGVPDLIFVQYFNHLPMARQMAVGSEVGSQLKWGGPSTLETVTAALEDRMGGVKGGLGILGPVGHRFFGHLADRFGPPTDLGRDYVGLRLVKSPEEMTWLRAGAYLSDCAIDGLRRHVRPGLTEHELADIVERAYVPLGGTTHIHYLGVTSMTAPEVAVPRQFASSRPVGDGDVIICEISAAFWGYAGQVLRSFTVGAPPTPLYRNLMQTAEAAFDAITGTIRAGVPARALVEAAACIAEAGFTTIDDVVHGYGGGYLPPVLSAPGRAEAPIPDMELAAGMTLVVQPNVVTKDKTAGVQTGELVLVTDDGCESLHRAPRGFLEITGL
ncbi:MAG: M24 family metallopeptidase [Alphaproteobacteria bacterium]|nr:M24 family metallopeptidase [Alphaproteobacteria bacterium]